MSSGPPIEWALELRRPAALSQERARELGRRQNWWLRDEAANDRGESPWVDIGRWRSGAAPLEASVRLAPGIYTLGCGTFEDHREEIEIGPDGREVAVRAPCVTPGCAGVLVWDPADLPENCEAFELRPPASRLCEECRS